MRRDRITFGMMIGRPSSSCSCSASPTPQLRSAQPADAGRARRQRPDHPRRSPVCRTRPISIFAGRSAASPKAREALRRGDANFVIVIPQNLRARRDPRRQPGNPRRRRCLPTPPATGGAVAALSGIVNVAVSGDADRPLAQPASPTLLFGRRPSASSIPRAGLRPISCRACSPSSCR